MAEPVRFVRLKICEKCGAVISIADEDESKLCPKCKAEREEKDNETPDIL